MDCTTAQDHFLAHSLGEPTPAEVAEHVAQCEACSRAFREFSEAGRLLRSLEPVPVREGFADAVASAVATAGARRGAPHIVWSGALAAAILLLIGTVGLTFLPRGSGNGPWRKAEEMAMAPPAGLAPASDARAAAVRPAMA